MRQTIKKSDLLRQLGAILNVSNLQSPRSWRPVANQYELRCEHGTAFQSYDSLIAVRMGGRLYLTSDHDYSKTTSKYATEWTGRTTKERRQGIESGHIVFVEED